MHDQTYCKQISNEDIHSYTEFENTNNKVSLAAQTKF